MSNSTVSVSNSTDRNAYCGMCGHRSTAHPILNVEPHLVCNRLPEEVGTLTWENANSGHRSIVDTDYYSMPLVDYSGTGVKESSDFDRWDINADFMDSSDLDRIDAYRDLNESEHTVTLDEYRAGVRTVDSSNVEPASRSAYVEGIEGFFTETVWDDGLTRKYHARLLNVFRVDGYLRIGSIRITYYPDGSIRATCVKCSQHMSAKDCTRDEQETFVLACIRHGNNHAANWFTSRPTFYKVHADTCDTNCGNSYLPCNTDRMSTALSALRAKYVS